MNFGADWVGRCARFSKTVSESDVYLFAGITGDLARNHVDEAYMRATPFGGRIAHGLYTAGLISAVIGTRLPGPGAIYLSQTLRFKAPVRIGDTVTASVEIVELIEKGHRARRNCACHVGDLLVLEGEALVKIPTRAESEPKWE